MMLLHGEEKVVFHRPLEIDQTYYIDISIVDCQDKKKGALIIFGQKVYKDKECTVLMHECFMSVFIRGIGNFSSSNKP